MVTGESYIKQALMCCSEIVINPGVLHLLLLGPMRQLFCSHEESFAYCKYGDIYFVEFSNCANCGKTLKYFQGFDADMRG